MGVNEHFESIFNAVMCQLKSFKTASKHNWVLVPLLTHLIPVNVATESALEASGAVIDRVPETTV